MLPLVMHLVRYILLGQKSNKLQKKLFVAFCFIPALFQRNVSFVKEVELFLGDSSLILFKFNRHLEGEEELVLLE